MRLLEAAFKIGIGILMGLAITSCSLVKKLRKKPKPKKVNVLQQNFITLDSLFNEGFDVTDTRKVLGETILYLSKDDVNYAFSERYGIIN